MISPKIASSALHSLSNFLVRLRKIVGILHFIDFLYMLFYNLMEARSLSERRLSGALQNKDVASQYPLCHLLTFLIAHRMVALPRKIMVYLLSDGRSHSSFVSGFRKKKGLNNRREMIVLCSGASFFRREYSH